MSTYRYLQYCQEDLDKAVKVEKEFWIIKMLEIRDALIKNTTDKTFNIDEAYHIIYKLASPEFKQYHPWKKWENIRRGK